jgi:murein DD-endopeptidase MepM/ murein hydrolase activator NlpD
MVELTMIRLLKVFKGWKITQDFGLTNFAREHPNYYKYGVHTGIDFGMPKGTNIKAPHSAVVVKVNRVRRYNKEGKEIGTGLSVSLWDTVQDIATRYYHLNEIFVKKGQVVDPGTVFATVGNTGLSTASHLHFELLQTLDGFVINKNNGAGGAIDPYNEGMVIWLD